MKEPLSQPHNDNDIVAKEEKNNDNDIVVDNETEMWKTVRKEISEYKLDVIQNFMFGGTNKFFGDCTVFENAAIKQIERFAYVWMDELSEEGRKTVINYVLGTPEDDRTRYYSDYTNSPIWKYVSSVIKLVRNYTCEECGKRSNPAHLVVHHMSYAHLGSELNHLDDLAVLCTDCHMKVHGVRRKK